MGIQAPAAGTVVASCRLIGKQPRMWRSDPSVTGAKAARPARAAVAGPPVLPGFVMVPAERAPGAPTGPEAVRSTWRALAGAQGQERPVVVRSSSVYEDTEDSSMAGRFESVLDVPGRQEFTAAAQTVLASARRVRPLRPSSNAQPGDGTAVLVQPILKSVVGGVVRRRPGRGRTDRIRVSTARGGPDQLVDGSTQGVRRRMTRRARRALQRARPRILVTRSTYLWTLRQASK
ncbi:PEP/pyruvate-binding domain-containing protein [Streptomyces sp. NPDC001970]